MSDFKIVDVPERKAYRTGQRRLYEAVIAAEGRAVLVTPNGRPQKEERNLLQNGLSLFCSRYHHGKFSPHTSLQSDGAIVLWVTPKDVATDGDASKVGSPK